MQYTPPLYPAPRLDRRLRTAVFLLGMGGPDGPASVGPFLRNLFADPLVLPLPAWLSRPLGRWIVRRRRAEVTARYATLGAGGGSPQLGWTERQAARLGEHLASRGLDVVPLVAMRYWHPFSDDAVARAVAAGARQLVAVPTYPQYSVATTGSSLAALARARRDLAPDLPLHVVRQWPLLDGYVAAVADAAAAVLASWRDEGVAPERCALVYTAHSLPVRFDRRGDPYARQTRATVARAHARVRAGVDEAWFAALRGGGGGPRLAYQSKVGPVAWLAPATLASCVDLARAGATHLLVVPVSFACEHIETLDELDRELAHAVAQAGVTRFARTPALNLHDGWLRSLAGLVAARAFGPVPAPQVREVAP